ncbi:hypothetical protein MASR1M31_08450 [Porphyromonadaceae bacterium]
MVCLPEQDIDIARSGTRGIESMEIPTHKASAFVQDEAVVERLWMRLPTCTNESGKTFAESKAEMVRAIENIEVAVSTLQSQPKISLRVDDTIRQPIEELVSLRSTS